MKRLLIVCFLCAWLSAVALSAQSKDLLFIRAKPQVSFPIGASSASTFDTGLDFQSSLDFLLLPFLSPFVQVGYSTNGATNTGKSLEIPRIGLGAGFKLSPSDRLVLRFNLSTGIYDGILHDMQDATGLKDVSAANLYGSAGIEAGLRISPAISASLSAEISNYFVGGGSLLSALNVGLGFEFNTSELAPAGRVRIENPKIEQVFPVFYSHYDDNSFGSFTLDNAEESGITEVQVSFITPQYMDQPKICATYPSVAKNGTVTVPVFALFNDSVLSLTENSDVQGEIVVDYKVLGTKRQVKKSISLYMDNRNAMTWDDDRRAAAFVSPTNPASLWFSKFVAGIVRDRIRPDINENLQYAIGLFEAERVYGINYVVDPDSSYVVQSASPDVPDYLQFPHQTLFYRGGDCDDLSILMSSLLESIGIKTAFITIPGHIYMAFDLGISEDEAKKTFTEPGLLIYRDGEAWLPLEITMIKDGFNKAWRVGAKEWYDNLQTGAGNFYPMHDSWALYKPVGIPNVSPRFNLPDESLVAAALDDGIGKYVAREIDPQVQTYKTALATKSDPAVQNAFGVLYGQYGMLQEAWNQFAVSAKANNPDAWTNLGNVAFLRQDYKLSISYYQWAIHLNPNDSEAYLGIARSQYELDDFSGAETAYAQVKSQRPELADKYGYLSSTFGGEGRAWSFADRLNNTAWLWDRKGTEAALNDARQYLAENPSAGIDLSAALQVPAIPDAVPDTQVASLSPRSEDVQVPPLPSDDANASPIVLVAASKVQVGPADFVPPSLAVADKVQVAAAGDQVVQTTLAPEGAVPQAAETESIALLEGFNGARVGLGTWKVAGDVATQTDSRQLFAKLILPLSQTRGKLTYSFDGKSLGKGWAGYGLHLVVGPHKTDKGYGAGSSILVWLNSDPQHGKGTGTHIQIYRSVSDTKMNLDADLAIPESIFTTNSVKIVFDIDKGAIEVFLNDKLRFSRDGFADLKNGSSVIFRALDRAEFQNFRVDSSE